MRARNGVRRHAVDCLLERHLEMMRHPERWPRYPFLALTNPQNRGPDGWPQLGLLYDAVVRALVRGRPLARRRRRGSHFVIAAPNGDAPALVKVKAIAGQLTGTVTGTTVAWAEAVEVSLTFRLGQLWLLIEPRVWTDPPPDRAARFAAQEFVRTRTAPRYNLTANTLLDAWRQVLLGDGPTVDLRAFGAGDGVDAAFVVHTTSAFSWRRSR